MAELVQTEAERRVTRAIEGRYLPAARADRRAAQKASREAARPAPSRVGWNSRATNKELRRERAAAEARDAREAARLTDEDKAIRRELAAREKRWDHKRHGTPATLEHATVHRTGALARLCKDGAITADQLAAALEIAEVCEQIARDVTPRTASFETRIDAGQRGDGTFYEALGGVWRHMAYDRWRAAMQRRAPIGVVLDMVVGESAALDRLYDDAVAETVAHLAGQPIGYSVAARRWGMSARRAKALLIDALDLWWQVFGQVRREIDQRDLDQAHARLA